MHHMSDMIKKSFEEAKKVALTKAEKAHVRKELLSFMQKNPVREIERFRLPLWRLHNPFYFLTPQRMPIITLILVLVMSFGTAFAAESSLPGDALYPFKIHVNEEVEAWFALSDKAKAELQSDLSARRLEESEKLASSAELNADLKSSIASNFAAHADLLKESIAKLQADNESDLASDISSHFEASLRAHAKVLASLRSNAESDTRNAIDDLMQGVNVQIEAVAKVRAEAESDVVSKPKQEESQPASESSSESSAKGEANVEVRAAAEGKLNAASNKIDEVGKFIENHKVELSADVYAEAQARLKNSESLVAEGKAKLEAKAYAEAFMYFQNAHRTAEEAQAFATALLELHLNASGRAEGSAEGSSSSSGGSGSSSSSSSASGSTSADVEVHGNSELNLGL